MQIAQYLFQSPSPNPVQVGRLDPTSVENQNSNSSSQDLPKAVVSQTETKAQTFEASQTKDVKPSVTLNAIDTYA